MNTGKPRCVSECPQHERSGVPAHRRRPSASARPWRARVRATAGTPAGPGSSACAPPCRSPGRTEAWPAPSLPPPYNRRTTAAAAAGPHALAGWARADRLLVGAVAAVAPVAAGAHVVHRLWGREGGGCCWCVCVDTHRHMLMTYDTHTCRHTWSVLTVFYIIYTAFYNPFFIFLIPAAIFFYCKYCKYSICSSSDPSNSSCL